MLLFLLELNLGNKILIGIVTMLLLFASFLYAFISNQRRKLKYHKNLHALQMEQQDLLKSQNTQLEQNVRERTSELSQQKEALQKSLTELQSMQRQLVQKEKMASLGELTAGIAHEIQNPLNFVNNFSDTTLDILDEAKEELQNNQPDKALDILTEATSNLKKIAYHGKRAEAIVKNMLEHSRKSVGIKEQTDVNALIDEYLKLAYHGYRAKDVSFNAALQTQYDPAVGNISLLPQEFGRAMINLFNNAFYSLKEKKKLMPFGYEPQVLVQTNKKNNLIEVVVKDNGMGIPEKVLAKIYQPFFTTKPTGEGTGLGLSLSFDIITKVHGGNLSVESKEGEGTEFTIQLPIE